MDENALFAAFVALPIVLLLALVFFFQSLRRRQTPVRWKRLVLGNTLVLLQLLSVVLLAGEVYYRFIYDTTDAFALSKTTTRWFERHFQLNRNGFRDSVDYALGVRPGDRRVTFLGDSFTAGHGIANVEDRFANRIRSDHVCDRVNVVAQCGVDTGQEIALLEDLSSFAYEFDLVVLVYCLNDISDIVPGWQDQLDRIYNAPSPGCLLEESYFLNTLYCRWRASHEPAIADYYGFIRDAYQGPVWQQQQERLRRIRDHVQAHDGRLLVVTFPLLHALGPGYRYRFVHELLDEFWHGLGVPHLDLLPTYESLDPHDLVVGRADPHPNERAHGLAASSIAEFLAPHLREESAGE